MSNPSSTTNLIEYSGQSKISYGTSGFTNSAFANECRSYDKTTKTSNYHQNDENRVRSMATERFGYSSKPVLGSKAISPFKQKFHIFLLLCFAFLTMGWVMAQLGPSLLDLQQITESSLEEASLFVTATFIGYLAGAVASGAVFERINAYLIIFISLMFMAATCAAIPFCVIYEVMVFMHILKGIGAGILDSAGNSLLMLKFRTEKSARSYLQTVHFAFAVGGILSPIATAPFLLQTLQPAANQTEILICNTTLIASTQPSDFNGNPTLYYSHISNYSLLPVSNQTQLEEPIISVLYQAYLISAGLCVTAAIPFLFMCFRGKSESTTDHSSGSNVREKRKLPTKWRVILFVLMSLFIGTDNGMEDTYFGFFTTFTVKEFDWSKQIGSYAASLYWAAYAFGRFSAIFIVPYFKPSTLLRIYVNILLVAEIGLFLSTLITFHTGIWIFSPFVGFAISVFFPSIFSWTEEDFLAVTGRVASLLMFSASLGSMINPIMIGYLMDNFSSKWFMYITLGQTVGLLMMTWIATLLTRKVRNFPITCNNEIEISVDIEDLSKSNKQ